jgi:hypothetical protein
MLLDLGYVTRLQVAPQTPKRMEPDGEVYDPTPIRSMSSLLISARGVVGVDAAGCEWKDVHHADHPASRFRGDNGVSIGFIAAYRELQRRFGSHLADGSAAENILLESPHSANPDMLNGTIVLHQERTGQQVELGPVLVAEPCLPFARFVAGPQSSSSVNDIRTTLQQLRHGMRGFYIQMNNLGESSLMVQCGDRLLLKVDAADT